MEKTVASIKARIQDMKDKNILDYGTIIDAIEILCDALLAGEQPAQPAQEEKSKEA
jgi:hypothetical protein